MTRLAALVAACAVVVPAVAPAQSRQPAAVALDPEALSLAAQIVDRIMPPDRRIETFMAAMTAIGSQMRSSMLQNVSDPDMRRILDSELDTLPSRFRPVTERHIPAIITAMTRAYAREFSTAELREISAFARSAAGAHYLGRSSAILSDPDVAAANREYFTDAQAVQQQMRTSLEAKMAAYAAAHSDKTQR